MFHSKLSKYSYFGDEDQPNMRQNGQSTPANTALSDSLIGFSTFPDQVFR